MSFCRTRPRPLCVRLFNSARFLSVFFDRENDLIIYFVIFRYPSKTVNGLCGLCAYRVCVRAQPEQFFPFLITNNIYGNSLNVGPVNAFLFSITELFSTNFTVGRANDGI